MRGSFVGRECARICGTGILPSIQDWASLPSQGRPAILVSRLLSLEQLVPQPCILVWLRPVSALYPKENFLGYFRGLCSTESGLES